MQAATFDRNADGHQGGTLLFVWLLLLLLLLLSPHLAEAGSLRVAVISDLNGSYGSTDYEPAVQQAVARILELRPDLVISTGDMVAGQRKPHLEPRQIEAMWEAFHAQVSEPLAAAGIPLAVAPGNHDGSAYHGFERERAIYAAQWAPRPPAVRFVDKSGYPFHYAFAAADVLFIALDATTVGRLPAQQMDWLRQLLRRHGPEYERRVVFSHLPLWPIAQGREREYIGDPALQALLAESDVDLFLSGHHHAFYPGSRDGVALVGLSCLGAGPRRLLGTADRSARGFALVELGSDPVRITAYSGPDLADLVDWQTLPRQLHNAGVDLVRADLTGTAQPGIEAEQPAASDATGPIHQRLHRRPGPAGPDAIVAQPSRPVGSAL